MRLAQSSAHAFFNMTESSRQRVKRTMRLHPAVAISGARVIQTLQNRNQCSRRQTVVSNG